jgi:hypothetical protein
MDRNNFPNILGPFAMPKAVVTTAMIMVTITARLSTSVLLVTPIRSPVAGRTQINERHSPVNKPIKHPKKPPAALTGHGTCSFVIESFLLTISPSIPCVSELVSIAFSFVELFADYMERNEFSQIP